MDIPSLVTLIIWMLVLGIVYWLALYVIQAIPIPDPPARFIKIALTVIMVLIILNLILQMVGVHTGVNMPRTTTQ